jgi:NAD(P)-dependent dehydrogenase (short-subunit alcohol dehydrogenase family)
VSEATGLLRPGLLEGVSLLVAGAPPPDTSMPVAGGSRPVAGGSDSGHSLGRAVGEACTELGARVQMCAPDVADEAIVDRAVLDAVAEAGSLDLLVVDGAGLFMHGRANGGSAHAALRTCLDATWNVTRAVVNHAFLPAEPSSPTGRIV